MELYKYIFYQFYKFGLDRYGKSDLPHYNAILGLSFLNGANILLAMLILSVLFDINLISNNSITLLIIIFLLLGFNFYLFIYKRKYLVIAKYFNRERHKPYSRFSAIIYAFVSIFSIIISVYLLYLRNINKL
jgi:hypothetical protein